MNCPDCGVRMRCADSRDVKTKSFGEARRRRYHCDCGNRYSTAEVIVGDMGGTISVEVALRDTVDEGFRERVRSLANTILNEAGGK